MQNVSPQSPEWDEANLFSDEVADSPAAAWDRDVAKRSLDELFAQTYQYKSSKAYHELLAFIRRFRFYSPYNAMLIHVQMPGARFVAPPHRWNRDYGRTIKPGARPLVILQPKGPVMFVFDVGDTEGDTLPPEVESPFEVRGGKVGNEIAKASQNAQRDGILVHGRRLGTQQAGSIRTNSDNRKVAFENEVVPIRYELELNDDLSREARFVTLAHELGHLYMGHLGTPNPKWWPDRRGLEHSVREFEAESVAFLVCSRIGIDNPSEQYLAGYVKQHEHMPPISLECVMKSAGLIESMSKSRLKPRKKNAD